MWRSRRGDNRLLNLTTLCDAHHTAVHEGRLRITGTAGALQVTHADGRPYGTPAARQSAASHATTAQRPVPDAALIADARGALTSLGFAQPRRTPPWTRPSPTWVTT